MGVVRSSFRCAYCRVWTGESHHLASASVTCDESEMQVIDGLVRVEWASARRALSVSCDIDDQAAARRRRTITIEQDSIRTIEVYCPSPFSTTVILQVDASETTQQCFLLSQVSAHDQQDDALDQVLRLGDRRQMLAFLAALHDHLKEVPLTAAARDLLAQKRNQESMASVNANSKLLKRRRTISPKDFYGGASQTSTLTALPTPLAEDRSAWSSFYERLQYNVSHSLLCQLEGTAPLSASFPRQQEAFEFVDQVLAFRERLAQQRALVHDPFSAPSSESDCDEPRVFCFEGANEGKRRFWATTLSAFWKEYAGIPEGSRHVYEIIREGVPCRLYFDLEFKKKLNPAVDGDALVARLMSLVQLQIYRCYHLLINIDKHIVQLESSTPDKFSRHLTVYFPNEELFVDNLHAGAFVRQLIHELVATDDDVTSPFLVQDSASDKDQRQLFIDVGVYTRNRMFRVLGSSKFGKTAVLRPMATHLFEERVTTTTVPLNHELFLRSIVCPHGTRPKTPSKVRLLRCDDAVSLRRYGLSSSARTGNFGVHNQSMRSVESRASIYPALDAFIRSIATTGGPQGEIRAVHLLYADTVPPTTNDAVESTTLNGEPAKIVYHMMKNRWCERVGRAHKSNNVMFVVDVARREVTQRCHDPQCQATTNYRPLVRLLPPQLNLERRAGC